MPFQIPDQFADSDYPTTWSQFIGQDKAKEQIKLAADSAKARKANMDHMLIASGTPGIGKTSLALLAAKQMNANLLCVSGPITPEYARILLSKMNDGEILFIDEAHKLVEGGKKNAEWLLHYLQDGILVGPYMREVNVPQVTVIAATTEAGKLPETIVGRFPIKPQLVPYTHDEAAKIVEKMAKRMLSTPVPTRQNCLDIATAANYNPRAIHQVVITLRDLSITGKITFQPKVGYPIPTVLEWYGVSPDGLTQTAQRYLKILADDFQGKAGQKAIEERLQEPGGLGDVERVLVEKQLIAKTPSGRAITMAGAMRAKQVA